MPKFYKKQYYWKIRFKKSGRDPVEQSFTLPLDTPVQKVRQLEGKMNAAYFEDWDPWVETWKEYSRRKQMQSDGVIDSGLTLNEAIDVFIDKRSVRGRINSVNTEKNYRNTLDRLSDFLGSPFMLRDLKPRHAEMFIKTIDVKPSTLSSYAARISIFYSHWHKNGMIRECFEYNYRSKPREDQIKYITEAQKNKILAEYRNNKPSYTSGLTLQPRPWMDIDDIIEVLFYQGFRKSEMFDSHITRGDVDLGKGKVKVLGKGNKYRVVDITPPVREHFQRAHMNTSESGDNLFLFGPRRLARILKRLAKKALGEEYGWISLHNLRHSCGTYWAGLGVPVATIQKLLGHSSINTTMIYAKITDDTSQEHFERAFSAETPITNISDRHG